MMKTKETEKTWQFLNIKHLKKIEISIEQLVSMWNLSTPKKRWYIYFINKIQLLLTINFHFVIFAYRFLSGYLLFVSYAYGFMRALEKTVNKKEETHWRRRQRWSHIKFTFILQEDQSKIFIKRNIRNYFKWNITKA